MAKKLKFAQNAKKLLKKKTKLKQSIIGCFFILCYVYHIKKFPCIKISMETKDSKNKNIKIICIKAPKMMRPFLKLFVKKTVDEYKKEEL